MACRDTAREDHCHSLQVDFLIGNYPHPGTDVLIQRIHQLDETTSAILEDQAILHNDLKGIRLHQEDYEVKLERMLVQHQGVVDNMI